ncbi:ck1 family protein kinase [Stylonychia lemnae]|uniref:Casein kinase I n=1 Tax=Stylonychia lemnae TaxID=5949 RepID=A0A078AIA3_STYLE|nr:ck1 family protein kinase [Stylonychia lemnae]|eukprot:CDW81237.1 ck1 family protein kinase [Stylonychia lemnae]
MRYQDCFPKYISSGYGKDNKSYLAIEVLGPSLKKLLHHSKHGVSLQTINLIKKLHQIGFVHRDIKPDNILIRSFDLQSPESSLFALIDFSASETYIGENNKHIKNERQKRFNGNFAFSSVYQMLGHSPSRKDDLLSIFYLLLFLKEGQLPWTVKQQDGTYKKQTFEQKPDYNQILDSLYNQLLRIKINKHLWVMDWTKFTVNWVKKFKEFEILFQKFDNNLERKREISPAPSIYDQNVYQTCQLSQLTSKIKGKPQNQTLSLTQNQQCEVSEPPQIKIIWQIISPLGYQAKFDQHAIEFRSPEFKQGIQNC